MHDAVQRGGSLRVSALAALLIGLTGVNPVLPDGPKSADPEARSPKPNFLFVLTDDQNYQAMSCAGHPFLRTPNMDRLAREGVRFRNAFVTSSVCSPSRASFLTGVHPHIHGVLNNEDYKDPVGSIPNIGQLLKAQGYETAFLGKWHMGTFWDDGPRPGFDHWLSWPIQGEYIDPETNENGRQFADHGYVTDLLTEHAIRWLKQERERPFCLLLWHKAAHAGFIPAERHRDALAEAEIPEPPNYGDNFADKPEWLRRLKTHGGRRRKAIPNRDRPVPERLEEPEPWDAGNQRTLDYYRTLLAVDEGLGKVLECLEQENLLDNTVIIYSSDNGFLLGAHRLTDKRLMFEESIRIPLLVRYPARFEPGRQLRGMALNIDIVPTILDLANAAIPDHVQGKSLVPLLEGKADSVRDSFFYAYYREEWLPNYPLIHGVRTPRWKYVVAPDLDDIPELYDLREDPYELKNLSQDPAYSKQQEEMAAELERSRRVLSYPQGPQKLGAYPLLQW